MKQVTRSLLVLGGLAVVGGGALWLASNTSGTGDDDKKPRRLVDLAETDLNAVDIRVGGTAYRLELSREGWIVVGEPPIGADPARIGELLGTFVHMSVQQTLSPDETPSDEEMGLASGSTIVAVFHEGDGREHTLTVGSPSAFDHNVFARFAVGDDAARAILLAPSARTVLEKPASNYYDRRPLGVEPEQLREIVVTPTTPGEDRVAYRIARTGAEGRWYVKEPDLGEADPFVVRQLFEGLAGTRLSVFRAMQGADDPARHGLEPPEFTVTVKAQLHLQEDAALVERTLRVSAVQNPDIEKVTDQTVLVARGDQPWVAEVSALLFYSLPRRIDDLKSKRLSWVAAGDVARIEMELLGAGKVTLERESATPPSWRMLSPEPAEASPNEVNVLLLALGTLSGISREAEGEAALDEATLARTGLGDDADRVRLIDESGKVLVELRLGKVHDGSRFVTAEGAGFIARVPLVKLKDLPNKPAELFKVQGLHR